MRQTISERILSEHAGRRVKAGDIVVANVDFCFGQDNTSGRIIDSFQNLGVKKIFSREKFCMVMDHSAPSPSIGVSEAHAKMRKFAREYGIVIYDIGHGICHEVISEMGNITCGDLIIGADSHSCTYGALNALSMGVGATDLAIAITCGKSWFRVPETIKVVINGNIPKGVYAKDIILHIIKDIGASGAAYKSIEFYGGVIDTLSMDARFTIANMSAEMGAKCGIMRADKKTFDWLKRHSVREPRPVEPDEDARYLQVKEYNISDLVPQVSCPDTVDNVWDVHEVLGVPVNEVYIGTCANGRFEDLEIAARMLKGRKVAHGVKLIITPASKKVYLEILKKKYLEIFVKAGAVINNPGCGPCVGTHQGVLADGENAFSTSNRNLKGIMGNPNAFVYLGSPATAVATALAGKIADPRGIKIKN
ncbi:MAG: 3-isopropylmalate dehydratase large subunit [Candidatus Omnitrophota bacterium]